MSEKELRDELMTLLLAGHETTATGLAWAFERLTRTPRVHGRAAGVARRRRRRRLPRRGREGDAPRAAGRLRRRAQARGARDGQGLGAARRHIRGALDHGDPPAAGASTTGPDEFRPERFLDGDQPDSYAWIPFGGGRRRCIGAAFATMEMKAVLQARCWRASTCAAPDPEARAHPLHNVTLVPAKARAWSSANRVRAPLRPARREPTARARPERLPVPG